MPQQTLPAGPRIVVALGPVDGTGRRYRVLDPARVLRMWALLNQASQELSAADLPPDALARLHRLFLAVTAELRPAFSAALTNELDHLIGGPVDGTGTGQVRIEYAGLLGWLSGLVISMFGELDAAAGQLSLLAAAPAGPGQPPSGAAGRGRGGEGSLPGADHRRAAHGAGPAVPPRLTGSLDPSPYL